MKVPVNVVAIDKKLPIADDIKHNAVVDGITIKDGDVIVIVAKAEDTAKIGSKALHDGKISIVVDTDIIIGADKLDLLATLVVYVADPTVKEPIVVNNTGVIKIVVIVEKVVDHILKDGAIPNTIKGMVEAVDKPLPSSYAGLDVDTINKTIAGTEITNLLHSGTKGSNANDDLGTVGIHVTDVTLDVP